MHRCNSLVIVLALLAPTSCDPGRDEADDSASPRLDEQPAPDWQPTSEPFVLPSQEEGSEAAPSDPNSNLIIELPTDEGGRVRFVDRAQALDQEHAGVAVIALGSAVGIVTELMEEQDATALEVYLALADRSPPDRLIEEHALLAAAREDIPEQPRDFGAGSEFRNHVVTTLSGECPSGNTFTYWKGGWKSWSSTYGNQISCTSVTQDIDVLTWSSAKRSIASCCHNSPSHSTDYLTVTYYGWNGTGWAYFDGPFNFRGTNTNDYGQAVYYGISSLALGQDKAAVRNVSDQTVYVGARSQITGGTDQC